MPRNRNTRSISPRKNVSSDSQAELQKKETLQNVKEIFDGHISEPVILRVLEESNWKEEVAIDRLLTISTTSETGTKSQASSPSQVGVKSATECQLSQSDKVIRRPTKTSNNEKSIYKYQPTSQYAVGGSGANRQGNNADMNVNDLHFPCLPSKSSTQSTSIASSVNSHQSYKDIAYKDVEKQRESAANSVLLSQAQNAYHQQYDDAEGAQRWEQCKQILSEHYLGNLAATPDPAKETKKVTQQTPFTSTRNPVFVDDPAVIQAEMSKPRLGRSFPVRLLSNPDDSEDVSASLPHHDKKNTAGEQLHHQVSLDLDETVLKCISEVHDDLVTTELAQCVSGVKTVVTPDKTNTQSNKQPMSLPIIGLSAEAAEFVPRSKTVTPTPSNDPVESAEVLGPTSSTAVVEAKHDGKSNVSKRKSPTVQIGASKGMSSPLTIGPSMSPGMSPPIPQVSTNTSAANLTGTPMFITPKWPPPPIFNSMPRPPPLQPPVMAPAPPSFVGQLPGPSFRLPGSRMVYSVTPPAVFHVPGIQAQYVGHPPPPTSSIEDHAAIATGQPIMATSEASRLMSSNVGNSMKQIEQKLYKIQSHHKLGRKVLIIMRGLPGSGKTTLARNLQMGGMVLSTDDYFMKGNLYDYNTDKLTEAHQWNRNRAKEAMKLGKSPIIIDNTNTQKWEFKPYVSMATNFKYHVEVMEPDTMWKFDPPKLAKYNIHNVPLSQIQRMLARYEKNITVDMLINRKKLDNRSKDDSTDSSTKDDDVTVQRDNSIDNEIQQRDSGQILEGPGKSLVHLNTFSKSDELGMYKQRSAESDSDSLSLESLSLHSGSISNTSSRNASPKPLRSSLKTPGMLTKLEPSKVIHRQLKPTVKKVKRKAIQQIEAKLSAETLNTVEELISEHVKDKVLSVGDVNRLEDELKALLTIMLGNESEMTAAEELISLKLYDLINKSFELEEDKAAPIDIDNVNTDTVDDNVDKNNVDESAGNENALKTETEVGTTGVRLSKTDDSNVEALDVEKEVVKATENEGTNIPDILGDSEVSSGLTQEGVVDDDEVPVVQNMTTSCSYDSEGVIQEPAEIENKYWGKMPEEKDHSDWLEEWDEVKETKSMDKPSESSSKDNRDVNKVNSAPSEVKNDTEQKVANIEHGTFSWEDGKPQRKKRNKLSQSIVKVNSTVEKGQSSDNNDMENSTNKQSENSMDVNSESVEVLKDVGDISTDTQTHPHNFTSSEIKNTPPQQQKSHHSKTSVNSEIDVDIEIESPPEFNRSLKMLKESYQTVNYADIDDAQIVNDVENAVDISDDTKDEVGKGESNGQSDLSKATHDTTDSNQSPTKTVKKSAKRKSTKPKNVPFLKKEDKEMFKTTAWNSFPVLGMGGLKTSNFGGSFDKLTLNLVNAGTLTCLDDFQTVERLENGGFIPSSVKYLTGRLFSIVNSNDEPDDIADTIPETHIKDKSTSTDDDLPHAVQQEELDFLQSCFPDVSLEELVCVLENCHNNTDWAVNLLIDWHYNVHFTEEEKKRFADGLKKTVRPPSPTVTKFSLEIPSGPKTLIDLCFGKIESEQIATRAEVEEQLIQTSRKRLVQIEDNSITKVRLHRSTSQSESAVDISYKQSSMVARSQNVPSASNDKFNPDDTNSTVTNNSLSLIADYTDSETPEISEPDAKVSLPSVNENTEMLDLQGAHRVVTNGIDEMGDLGRDVPDTEEMTTIEDIAKMEDSVSVCLHGNTVDKLEDMFGTITGRQRDTSSVDIVVDIRTAFMLHQCLKYSCLNQQTDAHHRSQQLKEDEEFARKLQQEINRQKPSQRRVRVDLPSTRARPPLVGMAWSNDSFPTTRLSAWSRDNQSLADIMKEEQNLQNNQQEIQKLLKGEDSQIAVKLRREKLYQTFRHVDSVFLDELFQANCYSLTETIEQVRVMLAEDSLNAEQDDLNTDHKLIEETKRQSMHQLLDSYMYQPMVSKDYQDGMDPEYEDYRGEANVHVRLRQECFQKAQEAYRRGLKQLASYYSQQGHQHTAKIKEANMRASEQILADRNSDLEVRKTLDLHGLHTDEAVAALDRILPYKERERWPCIMVVTGRGSHSRGGVARLRPCVISYLKRNSYSYTEVQAGVFKVNLKHRV